MNKFTCTHTAIQVEFLLNTTTAREDSVVKLDVQYLFKPPNVTLQEPLIVTVAVVNGSATGRLQVLLHLYCCIDSDSFVKLLIDSESYFFIPYRR